MRTAPDYPAARPPLSMRLRPGHWAALDYAFGVFIALFLYAAMRPGMRAVVVSPTGLIVTAQSSLTVPLGLFLVLVAGLATGLRRRRPILMLGVLLADSAVLTAMDTRPGLAAAFILPAAYVLYLVAATYQRRRDAAWVLAAVFVTLALDAEITAVQDGSQFDQPGLMLITLCMIIVWTAGYTMRQRRRYAVRLQDEAASKAVAQERLRIARELHDVVAHSMSVIAVQAGYGQYVIDAQPGDARAALGAIQATSREALDEMRRMLGALRQADDADARQERAGSRRGAVAAGQHSTPERTDDTDARGNDAGLAVPLWPAPGLADLDRLISRTAGAGVRVDVTRYGQPRELPASIDLSAYRIVQEALTNVVKHARTSSCRVLLGYRDDELTIEVSDDGAGVLIPEVATARVSQHEATASSGGGLLLQAGLDVLIPAAPPAPPEDGRYGVPAGLPGAGHGIIGMRERVSLLGGEFSAGPLPGYGFRVSACIPLPPGSA